MTFEFYAALTRSEQEIDTVIESLLDGYGSLDPIQNIMFTPIASTEDTTSHLKDYADDYGLNIMFDSGGYEVQVGSVEFDELISYLVDFHSSNDWGKWHVLPDNVPLSDDGEDTVQRKVNETLSASRICFQRLPEDIQKKSLGAVQGHTPKQISRCIEEYSSKTFRGLERVGFGSFATSGVNNGVNTITPDTLDRLEWAVELAHSQDLEVHAFGVGGPTSIPLLYEAGVDSFDTTSWMRTGGYGNVIFPFRSRYNVSHKKDRGGKTLTRGKLDRLKETTGHRCNYCENIGKLRDSRWNRILHNIIVTHESTQNVQSMETEEIIESMDESSRYRKYLRHITEN